MIFLDMHCDTISELCDRKDAGGTDVFLRENGLQLDIRRLREVGYLLQNFALFVDAGRFSDPWERFLCLADFYDEQMAQNVDSIAPVLCFSDIAKNRQAGKLSALLTIEEGEVLCGETEKLRAAYGRGVRMITLTWNYENQLGYPNIPTTGVGMTPRLMVPETEKGLKQRGIDLLFEMETMGIIIDVSHLSDAGFWDVVSHAKKPFVASHSNARTVSPCVRNMTDDMIRALSNAGGVMGLNFCMDFLKLARIGKKDELLDAVCAHAKHIVHVGGEDILGLGSDFDGIVQNADLAGAESIPKLFDALKTCGFTDRQLDKIASGNVLRLYQDTLPH